MSAEWKVALETLPMLYVPAISETAIGHNYILMTNDLVLFTCSLRAPPEEVPRGPVVPRAEEMQVVPVRAQEQQSAMALQAKAMW